MTLFFKVRELGSDDFKDCSGLDKVLINRHKNEEKNEVKWLKIKWMKFEKGSLMMQYKEGLGDDFPVKICDTCRNRRRTERALLSVQEYQPSMAYKDQDRKISFEKYTDLGKLLDYIPPIQLFQRAQSSPKEQEQSND